MLVVDAYPGARPLPAFSHKTELSLAAHLERDNTLSGVGEERLTEVVAEALRIAEDKGVEDFLGFATSAVRDAVNGDDVLARSLLPPTAPFIQKPFAPEELVARVRQLLASGAVARR